VTTAELQALFDAGGGQPVRVRRTCMDARGNLISTLGDNWSPAAGAPVLVDPRVLAETARASFMFPAPVVVTSPPAGSGTYAQLPTFFTVQNWAPVSRGAVAGPVTATVTATPVRQTWTIRDSARGTAATVSCDGPGAAYDPGRPLEVQLPPVCGWTPEHSSAGQSSAGGSGEACFATTVTLAWDVRWTSNIAPGGPLGEGTSTTNMCLVVAELQAVGTSG
jgi:hypothetical protein